jgi:cobyrinic acid a,c-diamide synthase
MIIAGCRSGEGKTTITLAILAYLRQQGVKVQSFKVGPDYIDPMFHTLVSDRPCRNLDPVLTSPEYVCKSFAHYSQGIEYTLIEGVMGLFDGVNREEDWDFASTAHIARLVDLPVVLVIDCSSLSGSVAAIAQGYRSLDPRLKLAGVILNRVGSDRHLELLTLALTPLNLPILGVIRRQDLVSLPSRH